MSWPPLCCYLYIDSRSTSPLLRRFYDEFETGALSQAKESGMIRPVLLWSGDDSVFRRRALR